MPCAVFLRSKEARAAAPSLQEGKPNLEKKRKGKERKGKGIKEKERKGKERKEKKRKEKKRLDYAFRR